DIVVHVFECSAMGKPVIEIRPEQAAGVGVPIQGLHLAVYTVDAPPAKQNFWLGNVLQGEAADGTGGITAAGGQSPDDAVEVSLIVTGQGVGFRLHLVQEL